MGQKSQNGRQSSFFAKIYYNTESTEQIKGAVEQILFQDDESSYTVFKLDSPIRPNHLITVVGVFPAISIGETMEIEGRWINHPTYGQQFKAESYHSVYPVTVAGITKFLGSGLIKGIGPATAKRIVDTFQEDTLSIIENYPEKLNEIEGIGRKKIDIITKGWSEQKQVKDLMLFLAGHNISTTLALKIYRHYGNRAIGVLQQDPYQMVYDITGVGFKTADKIALDLGMPADSASRIKAGVHFVLHEGTDEGHVYFPKEDLVRNSAELLGVDQERIEVAVETLLQERRLVREDDNLYISKLHHYEVEIVNRLHRLISQPADLPDTARLDEEIGAVESRMGIAFDELQKEAIRKAAFRRILVVTGGPGTGKTTMVRAMLDLFSGRNMRVALTAPTGRAAKRLEETTGHESKTIHRLLEFNPRMALFTRDEHHTLEYDVIIVDEMSMIDLPLFYALVKGVHHRTRLVLVGDVDQLPAVGPGNVLLDIITSNVVEVVRLSRIFRQSGDSDIISNAHRINCGEFPVFSQGEDSNFFFIFEEDPGKAVHKIKNLCVRRIPQKYKVDPVMDIQVITPMYKGDIGANTLNTVLQNALNPRGRELQRGGKTFRVGDKVMQIRNNYTKEVYNGDIGRVCYINLEEQELIVDFGGRKIGYEFVELDEIILAYAITVHKAQGSEYPVIIMPVLTQHFVMLQRNLLYTAVTRAKSLFVMVGTKKALSMAIKNNKMTDRHSSLAVRLQKPPSFL